MTRATFAVIFLGLAASGCGANIKDAKVLVNATPTGSPVMAGSYDFDLLDDVEGTACAERGDKTTFTTAVTGADLGHGQGLVAQAEAAAVFDALSKIKGADLMFVSRTRTEGDLKSRVCTVVYGKAVRLKKGPTIVPRDSALSGVEGPEPSAPRAAPEKEKEPAPPAKPASGK